MSSVSLSLITAEVSVIALVTILSSAGVPFQLHQDDTVTKPRAVSCNWAFSNILNGSITTHLEV